MTSQRSPKFALARTFKALPRRTSGQPELKRHLLAQALACAWCSDLVEFWQVHPCRTTPLRASEDCTQASGHDFKSMRMFCRMLFQLSTEIFPQRRWPCLNANVKLVHHCDEGELMVYELRDDSTFGAMRDRQSRHVCSRETAP